MDEQITHHPEVNETGGRDGLAELADGPKESRFRLALSRGLYAGSLKYKGQTPSVPVRRHRDLRLLWNRERGARPLPFLSDAWLQVVAAWAFDYWQRTFPFTSQRETGASGLHASVSRAALDKTRLVRGRRPRNIRSTPTRTGTSKGCGLRPESKPAPRGGSSAPMPNSATPEARAGSSPAITTATASRSRRWCSSRRAPLRFIAWQPRSSQDVVGLRIDYYF